MIKILDNDIHIATYIPQNTLFQPGLQFFSADSDFIQCGAWNYSKGKHLQAHVHNPVERTCGWTQEILFVQKGRLLAHIYGTSDTLIKEIELQPGDVLILLRGGHGYTMLEDNTCVLELKNGPYVGAEQDRRRLPL